MLFGLNVRRKKSNKRIIRLRVWRFAFSIEFPVRRGAPLTA
jgi:hypothetical protein